HGGRFIARDVRDALDPCLRINLDFHLYAIAEAIAVSRDKENVVGADVMRDIIEIGVYLLMVDTHRPANIHPRFIPSLFLYHNSSSSPQRLCPGLFARGGSPVNDSCFHAAQARRRETPL